MGGAIIIIIWCSGVRQHNDKKNNKHLALFYSVSMSVCLCLLPPLLQVSRNCRLPCLSLSLSHSFSLFVSVCTPLLARRQVWWRTSAIFMGCNQLSKAGGIGTIKITLSLPYSLLPTLLPTPSLVPTLSSLPTSHMAALHAHLLSLNLALYMEGGPLIDCQPSCLLYFLSGWMYWVCLASIVSKVCLQRRKFSTRYDATIRSCVYKWHAKLCVQLKRKQNGCCCCCCCCCCCWARTRKKERYTCDECWLAGCRKDLNASLVLRTFYKVFD